MNTVEIVLLIAGGIIFILSFIVPAGKEQMSEGTKELVKEEVRRTVDGELKGVKEKVSDIVDEAVTYSVEKTERSLERISNEKIMAVNEYSDTVLEEINKNHNEAMFLYDMLNDKYEELKTAAGNVDRTVREAGKAVRAAAGQDDEGNADAPQESGFDRAGQPEENREVAERDAEAKFKALTPKRAGKKTHEIAAPDISFISENRGNGKNNNDRILELHGLGRSNVAIAQELGLGIGEVKLVIDLFEGL